MSFRRRPRTSVAVPKALRQARQLPSVPGAEWIKSRNGYTLRTFPATMNDPGPPRFFDSMGNLEVTRG